jgi:hypothetical protein
MKYDGGGGNTILSNSSSSSPPPIIGPFMHIASLLFSAGNFEQFIDAGQANPNSLSKGSQRARTRSHNGRHGPIEKCTLSVHIGK